MPVSMQQILPTSQRLADLDTFVRIVLPIGTVYEYRFGRNVIGDAGATYNPDQGTLRGTLTANKTEVLTYRAQASSGGGGGSCTTAGYDYTSCFEEVIGSYRWVTQIDPRTGTQIGEYQLSSCSTKIISLQVPVSASGTLPPNNPNEPGNYSVSYQGGPRDGQFEYVNYTYSLSYYAEYPSTRVTSRTSPYIGPGRKCP